jgi:hypothetical protein
MACGICSSTCAGARLPKREGDGALTMPAPTLDTLRLALNQLEDRLVGVCHTPGYDDVAQARSLLDGYFDDDDGND